MKFTGKEIYKCEICGMFFKEIRSLTCHIIKKHKINILKEYADIIRPSMYDIVNNPEKIKEMKNEPYLPVKLWRSRYINYYRRWHGLGYCLVCGKKLNLISYARGFPKYCSKRCRNLSDDWYRKVNGPLIKMNEKKILCPECGRVFRSKKSFISHLKEKHYESTESILKEKEINLENKDNKCRICGKPVKFLDSERGYSKFCEEHEKYMKFFSD